MKSLAISIVLLALGVGMGAWVVSRRASALAEARSAEAGARTSLLQGELEAARAKIASMEAQLAAVAKPAPPTTADTAAAAVAEGPADLNTIFEQAKPLLQTLGPIFDTARRRGSKARADQKVAEWTEKYGLTVEQQEAVKKWFEDKGEADAAKGRELLNKPGANLQELMAAGRGQWSNDGVDEMMAATLTPEQLTSYQADRLQDRADNVEKEANRRVTQLNDVVQLDEAQQDQVFAIMARSSRDYDPAMQLEGLRSEAGSLAEGDSRDEAILAVLRPDQRASYEADRQRRRQEAAQGFEALGLKPPADLGRTEGTGR